MKTKVCVFVFILMVGACHGADICNTTTSVPDKYFPNLFEKAPISYTMTVAFTVLNLEQTNFYVEAYDVLEKKGRVDIMQEGKITNYYYYSDVWEAFEISGTSCKKRNATDTPEFMGAHVNLWRYRDEERFINGPSAMFQDTYAKDKRDHSSVTYMGESTDTVRGFPAQYWRRCLAKNLTADFYFSSAKHEDVYGVKNLTEIPLRVVIQGVDPLTPEASKKELPQNYEIMSFAPDIVESVELTFELPVGLGCGRTPREDDNEIPSFERTSLFVLAEAIYTDYSTGSEISYNSNFMYAFDIETDFISYFYTPWNTAGGKAEAKGPVSAIYDIKNKYLYEIDLMEATCSPSEVPKYIPKYALPGGDKGYVSLTDPSIFYPNSEFHYLGEGIDRGYHVNIYEFANPYGYLLGDRVVTDTVVTHYYLKSNEIKRGPFPVEQALTRIQLNFRGTDDKDKKWNSTLNFNFYGFSTQIEQRSRLFDISDCFRNDDDSMMITIGFDADEKDMNEVIDEIPSIENNIRNVLISETEITPARLPIVMVDMRDKIYITFLILDRPPFQLDFDPPKASTTFSGATETQGITDLKECAFLCLESGDECWGFSHCGATCYVGAGEKRNVTFTTQADCQYYNRTNFNIIPRLRVVRNNLQRLVETKQIKLALKKKSGGMFFTTADYFEDLLSGDSEEMFELLGLETNPRFRVVKVAAKLTSGAGEKVKNFGRLTYGECQRMCLDYTACETVSYCANSGECMLSLTHGEDIPAAQMAADSFCNVLSRKYSDSFTRSPGNVLSQNAVKTVNAPTEEGCAKACAKETSFKCMSFDHCPASKDAGCRLHAVHYIDIKNNEGAVKKESICGHYSKKFSFDFKRQSSARTLGSANSLLIATNTTLEECAKLCIEYKQGTCHGFDVCQEKILTSTSCSVIVISESEMKTAPAPTCNHYSRAVAAVDKPKDSGVSNATAGGVGFLLFVIGCFVGGLIVFGVAYYRVNRSR